MLGCWGFEKTIEIAGGEMKEPMNEKKIASASNQRGHKSPGTFLDGAVNREEKALALARRQFAWNGFLGIVDEAFHRGKHTNGASHLFAGHDRALGSIPIEHGVRDGRFNLA